MLGSSNEIEAEVPSRQLLRMLRSQSSPESPTDIGLPENRLWQIYCELRRRGESDADQYFLRSIQRLLQRRSMGHAHLPLTDTAPNEHKLVDDPLLSDLWRAYKRCICNRRTAPAGQLLRDIATHLNHA